LGNSDVAAAASTTKPHRGKGHDINNSKQATAWSHQLPDDGDGRYAKTLLKVERGDGRISHLVRGKASGHSAVMGACSRHALQRAAVWQHGFRIDDLERP
jgi:hypothetical protein